MGASTVNARDRVIALAATAMLFSSLAAGLAEGNSRYPLTVVLWEDNGELKTAGQKLTVWAQVFSGDVPTNATSVTFHWGLNIPPIFVAAAVTGTYGGSPGLYWGNVTVTATDESTGFGLLEVAVQNGGDTATNSRIVYLGASVFPGPAPPATGWTVAAGVDNYGELGSTLDPGETFVWSIDTAQNGTPTNASSLLVRLFEGPEVTFSETPTNLTPVWASEGHYTVATQVPSSQTESVQYVLQATIDEGNFASVNATADVWFYDTVVDFGALDVSAISGTLTVGDGTDTQGSIAANLELTSALDSHSIGWINGTTDSGGRLAFSVANDGTAEVDVKGWMNGTFSQRVSAAVRLGSAFVPPGPSGAPLDAVPQDDPGRLAWERNQTIRYAFYQNGSLWANRTVLAYVSSARGILTTANLTTDANATAALTIDFSRVKPVSEDYVLQGFNQGLNITFRAAVGPDAASSDGAFWAEDEERAWPQPIPAIARTLFDTNLTFATEPMSLGASFGVGAKYVGPKNVTGYKGAAIIFPSSINAIFDGATERYAVWTATSEPVVAYLVDGDAQEYFGRVFVPSYWPLTTYTLLGAVVPSFSALGGEGGPTGGALNWIALRPGEALSEFVPAPDTTPPEIWGPANFTAQSYLVDFVAHVYDNSLDFGTTGSVLWQFDDGTGPQNFTGETGAWNFGTPGNYTVRITATDGSGNSANHTFVVTILDRRPPVVTAGSDFTALGGVAAQFQGNATDDDPAFGASALYSWSFLYNGSTVTLPGLAPSFTFWMLGTYGATLTATDAAGNSANDTVLVTVVSPDTTAPSVDAGADRTVDAGAVAAFSGSATDNDPAFPQGATCNWSFTYNGSAEQFNATGFSFTFWTLGTLDLTFACVDFWGNAAQDTLQVTVQKPDRVAPTVDAGADISVAAGEAVALAGQVTDNDPAFPLGGWIAWLFVYNSTSENLTGPNATFTFFVPGAYTVALLASDGWGNVGTDTLQVTVRVPDTEAPLLPGMASQTVLVGVPITLTAGATDNDNTFPLTGNISWSFELNGTPLVRFGDLFTFAFPEPGNFTVTLSAVDRAGNRAVATILIQVLRPDTTPPAVVASVDRASIEAGQSVTFTGSATDGGAPLADGSRFEWSFTYNGSLQRLQGLSPNFTFAHPGTYVVTLRVRDDAGNNGTAEVTVTVSAPSGGVTTEPGNLTLYILLALAAAAAVLVLLKMRPKALDGKPLPEDKEEKKGSGETSPGKPDADGQPAKEEEEQDLNDLLK